MSYTDFVKPYVDGWENGESGDTPITAEILNNNYDAFLIALNTWGAGVDTSLASKVTDANYVHTDNNYTSTEKNKLSGIASGATATSFNRIVSSGTKLGTLTINGTTYDIYAPNPGAGSLSDLTDVTLTSPSNGQVLKYDAANSKWINANESGGGGGSYSPNGVTYVIDNNGTDSVTTGHTYAYENKISKYVDGVLDSSGSWSYAQSMTTPTNYFIVGNLKSTYTVISGSAYWIVTVVDGYVRYNNVVYEATEEVFRVAVRSGTDDTYTGFEEVVEASPSVVEWEQLVQSGTKIATITIDGVDTDVYAPTSGGASTFSGLSDVTVSSPSTGQVPIYNATSSKWENGNLSVGDTVSYTDLQQSGTKIGTITINGTGYDVYAPTSGGASALSGLSDVTVSNPSNGQVLEYDGTAGKWKNANAPTVPDEITDLNDVSVSSLQNGQILKWNSTSSKWENANESGGGGGTTVVANPSGAATEELEKLQVGNTIYSLPSSSGGTDKALVMKTKTYTGTGSSTNAITFDEKPYSIYSIFGDGYNQSNKVMMLPFIYGETTYCVGSYYTGNGILWNPVSYSNNDLTMTMTAGDAGAAFNNEGSTYTIWYLVEETVGGGNTSITDYEGTLTAGQTSLTINGTKIRTNSVFDFHTSILGVGPTGATISNGSITLTFNAQQTDMDVLVSVRDKGIAPIPFDIDLANFVTDKVWYYYDSNKSSLPVSLGEGITLTGSDYDNDWTTSSCIGIDLDEYTIPVNLSKIKVHFKSLVTSGYAGACLFTHTTKIEGEAQGSDYNLRLPRLPIESGVYIKEDETNGLNLSDYTLEIPCTESALSRYLYIMLLDGVEPSWDGSTNNYSNALNGGYTAIIDGIWFE